MNVGTSFALNGTVETEVLSAVLLQMSPAVLDSGPEATDRNIDKIFEYLDRATFSFPGFDLALTPELIVNRPGGDMSVCSLTLGSPQVERLKQKCRELRIWAVFGLFLDLEDGLFAHNCALTINDEGEIANLYCKTNPWLPMEPFTPGDEIQVFEGPKGSRLSTIICADGDYLQTWAEAAHKGANVICRISDYMTPFQEAYEITNRAGAYFNRAYVLATNTAEMDSGFCLFGRSMAVSPEGAIIAEAPVYSPYIFKVDLYPGLCDHIRQQSFMGNLAWQTHHRGASAPGERGLGRDASFYEHLQRKER
jgi:amidase/formamidase